MSREGHKNTDLRQERTAGPYFYMAFDRFGWNLQKRIGQVTGGECLLGEGAVIILQELVQLFHIGNFLSVKEDEFDGIGFLISRRCGNNPSGTQPVFSYQNSLSV